MTHYTRVLIIAVLAFMTNHPSLTIAQEKSLTKREIKTTIDSLSIIMENHHNDPETGKKMAELLNKNFLLGSYDKISDKAEFAKTMESDLSETANDEHFHIFFDPEKAKASQESGENETLNAMLGNPHDNFGFEEVKILPGNIGYWKFNLLPYPHDAGNIATAALTYLSNTDALIIDLTENRGGYNEMLQFILSCFFRYPTHINTLYTRYTDETQQFWTAPYTAGRILDSLDIYVLTSGITFSAGEWLAYTLQEYDRATIIGETSKGGATPTEFFYIMDEYIMMLPNTTCVSPVSNSHFNNVGVVPDIKCRALEGKDIAYQMAVKKLDSTSQDKSHEKEYNWILDGLTAKLNPAEIPEKSLKEIPGKYGRSTIINEGGTLYFVSYNGNRYRMIPVNEDYYVLENLDPIRIEIIHENKNIMAIKAVYSNGYANILNKL